MYLEAYDALKAQGTLLPYDQDRNQADNSPRNRLRVFTKNFYLESKDVINSDAGWKKNHGIGAACALGLAAIVLNDAGVETNYLRSLFEWVRPAPNYSPQNWFNLSKWHQENLLRRLHSLWYPNVLQAHL